MVAETPPEGEKAMVSWSRKEYPFYIYNDGRVFSTYNKGKHKGKWIVYHKSKKYYKFYIITNSGRNAEKKVHEEVAKHFVPNPNNYPHIRHKDGNTFNNHFTNLEWVPIGT